MLVVFGCMIVGMVFDDEMIVMVVVMVECGVDEVGLFDISGYVNFV